jgi:dimethylargininase
MPTAVRTFKAPFVRDDFATLRAVIVAPPSGAIERERPVQGEPNAIAERARAQHAVLMMRLAAHGVKTIKLDADPIAPLGSLCADIAVVLSDGAVIMRPSDVNRRREIGVVEAALQGAGIPIVGRIEPPGLLDGTDILLAPEAVYLGVSSPRASETGIARSLHGNQHGREQFAALARARDLKVVEVPLAAHVRRLRSVAALVDANAIVCASAVLDAERFAGLERIDVPSGEDYAAGLLVIGRRRVITNLRFRETIPRLRAAKIFVDAIDLWEFGKIGATPSSLILPIKRG